MAKKSEDKAPEEKAPAASGPDLAAEFAELGRAMRNALDAAWNSQERQRFQSEIRSGLNKLADEMESAAQNIRQSDVGQQVEERTKQVRDDIQSGKVSDDVRKAVTQALRATRDAIDHMADSFTPAEKPKVEFDPIDMDKAKDK
jgi:uncharacterized protein YukE